MSHPYSLKSLPHAPGVLIFSPCPGTQNSTLAESLDTLKQAGAVVLVTLMSDAELRENGVDQLGAEAKRHGLEWFQLPIEDDQAPDESFEMRLDEIRLQLDAVLASNGGLAIHCKGGSGRTGLFAARLLIESGMPRSEAIKWVQELRPRAIQKPAHIDYINQFGEV
ncbi:Dual specificity phosphatase, catalytic domain [compost metagenome]